MYLEYLSQYEIIIESHVTRFGENLIQRTSNFEIRKVFNKWHVFASFSVNDMLDEYLQSSRDWIQSVRSIIQPIRSDIFRRKNCFTGNLIEKDQDESISPYLLTMTSMLIDGEVNFGGKCSQAALTVAELITFHARKLRKSEQHCNTHRLHKKERETPVAIYTGLKIYATVRS